ncbi:MULTISPECIES: alpha/beta fold hydrolase [Salimicrobium]|uniref:Esterase n=1 Tax=Salimicrobium humidisoli TaxID=2029857 RepID=A0ABX4HSB8_9BACI|nr:MULTISPECIES: alpha/beta fold hydrolase [Salimicrobium]PBB06112.1 esterase [Salimicrobium humidisoli]
MISVQRESWRGIPLLHVTEAAKQGEPLPVFTYFHGFTSAKEHNLPQAYLLAEKGYRVLLPDSLYHGEREEKLHQQQLNLKFWDIVYQNLKELQVLYDELEIRDLLEGDRFGVGGTSMGGITTTAALTMYPWISAACVMMGSPKPVEFSKKIIEDVRASGGELPVSDEELNSLYWALSTIDLSLHPEKLKERPLFFWHGDADPVVPFTHSYEFYNEVESQYRNKQAIRHIKEPGRDHKVSRSGILEMTKWLEKIL